MRHPFSVNFYWFSSLIVVWEKCHFRGCFCNFPSCKLYPSCIFLQFFRTWNVLYTDSQVFSGNFDRYTIVIHELAPPIRAKFVRFYPKSFRGGIAMRVEVFGCYYGGGKDIFVTGAVIWVYEGTYLVGSWVKRIMAKFGYHHKILPVFSVQEFQ